MSECVQCKGANPVEGPREACHDPRHRADVPDFGYALMNAVLSLCAAIVNVQNGDDSRPTRERAHDWALKARKAWADEHYVELPAELERLIREVPLGAIPRDPEPKSHGLEGLLIAARRLVAVWDEHSGALPSTSPNRADNRATEAHDAEEEAARALREALHAVGDDRG